MIRKALLSVSPAILAAFAGGTAFAAAGGMGSPMSAPTATPMQQQYPVARPMTQGTATQIPLSQVSDINALSTASVQDQQGNTVGSVRRVLAGPSGMPAQVQVNAGGTKVVTLDASRIKYERDRNVLITDLTREQIRALPAAQGT